MSFFVSVIKYLPYIGLAGLSIYFANKNITKDLPHDLDRQEEITLIKSCEAEIRAGKITRKDMAQKLKLYMMLYYEPEHEFRLLNYYVEKLEKSQILIN